MRKVFVIVVVTSVLGGTLIAAEGQTKPAAPSAGIEGEVVDDQGRPVARASVGLVLPFDSSSPEAWQLAQGDARPKSTTDGQGRFKFANVSADTKAGFEITALG